MSHKFKTAINISLSTSPASGNAGDLYYDTTAGAFKYYTGSTWSGIAGVKSTFSTTPPSGATAGDYWINSNTGLTYTYITDTNGSQWVDVESNSYVSTSVSVGTATPQALGTAAAGTAVNASHEDHIHPTTGLVTSFSAGTTGFSVNSSTGAITLSGTLAVANGGTNSTATPTGGAVAYGTGSAYAFTAAGTSGQFLMSYGPISNGGPQFISLQVKESVQVVSTTNFAGTFVVGGNTTNDIGTASDQITASANGVTTIDGYTLTTGDRVLLAGQTSTFQNGVYVTFQAGTASLPTILVRDNDVNTAAKLATSIIQVNQGTTNGGTAWQTTFNSTQTLGTAAVLFYKILNSASTINASTLNTQAPSYYADHIIPYTKTGALTTATGTIRYRVPWNATIVSATAAVGTAPQGSSLIVDVLKNGTTIYTTQANRPTIAALANATTTSPTPDVTSLVAGDYLTVNISQVGSTVAGSDLSVFVEIQRA